MQTRWTCNAVFIIIDMHPGVGSTKACLRIQNVTISSKQTRLHFKFLLCEPDRPISSLGFFFDTETRQP